MQGVRHNKKEEKKKRLWYVSFCFVNCRPKLLDEDNCQFFREVEMITVALSLNPNVMRRCNGIVKISRDCESFYCIRGSTVNHVQRNYSYFISDPSLEEEAGNTIRYVGPCYWTSQGGTLMTCLSFFLSECWDTGCMVEEVAMVANPRYC